MSAIQAAKVIRHANQVVVDRLLFICQILYVRPHVESLNREVNKGIILLLSCDLSIHVAKHARATAIIHSASLLEALQLDKEDLWHRVDLHLLFDVAMLLATAAVPLVIA